MKNSSQREDWGWQMPSLRSRGILQMTYWTNASFVEKKMDWTIIGIYKQIVTIATKLVTLQRSVRKKLPPEQALKTLLHTHRVYFVFCKPNTIDSTWVISCASWTVGLRRNISIFVKWDNSFSVKKFLSIAKSRRQLFKSYWTRHS